MKSQRRDVTGLSSQNSQFYEIHDPDKLIRIQFAFF